MVHLVLISYHPTADVHRLLVELCQNSPEDVRIHVVDNKGEEGIRLLIQTLSKCNYYYWGNLGYGPGFNKLVCSIEYDKEDIFIISNDDVQITSDTIPKLIDNYHFLKPQVNKLGILSPVLMSTNGTNSERFNEMVALSERQEFKFIPAVFWLFDANFLEQVGGFQPQLFLYGEDRELCDRSNFYGYSNFLIKTANIYHNFTYPPNLFKLKVMKEQNSIIAHYLNLNNDRTSASSFMIKGVLHAFFCLNVVRTTTIIIGYIRFISRLRFWSRTKANHKKTVPHRYVTKPI